MHSTTWKKFETFAADLIGGKRFWANSGELIDCESEDFCVQCKLVRSLSLAALSKLCLVAAEQAKAKGKIGLVVTKVSKRQLPAVISMTAEQFTTLRGQGAANVTGSMPPGASSPLWNERNLVK